MNKLSWILYLGDISGGVASIFGLTAFIAIIAGIVLTIVHFVQKDDHRDDFRYIHDGKEILAAIKKYRTMKPVGGIFLITLAFVLGVVACLAPSKDTIYAIAASQLGEQIIQTPLAGKAEKALEAWLDHQTAQLAPSPASK